MNSGSDDVDKGLVRGLEHHTRVLTEQQRKLNKLRRQRSCASGDSRGADSVEEQLLFEENVKLRRAIAKLKQRLRGFRMDPYVIELQNKVSAVWKEVADARREVRTLRIVRQQQRRVLHEVRAGERSVSAIRSRQHEDQMKLREELKDLTEELKRLNRRDIHLHERLADLQERVMMNVKKKDVAALRQRKEEQLKTIADLRRRQDEIALHRSEYMDEERRAAAQEAKAKERLKNEIEELKAILEERNEELCRLQCDGRKMSL